MKNQQYSKHITGFSAFFFSSRIATNSAKPSLSTKEVLDLADLAILNSKQRLQLGEKALEESRNNCNEMRLEVDAARLRRMG